MFNKETPGENSIEKFMKESMRLLKRLDVVLYNFTTDKRISVLN